MNSGARRDFTVAGPIPDQFDGCRLARVGKSWLRGVREASGRKSRPGTGSLHAVTVEAAAEVTKPLKPSMERVAMATWRACRPYSK